MPQNARPHGSPLLVDGAIMIAVALFGGWTWLFVSGVVARYLGRYGPLGVSDMMLVGLFYLMSYIGAVIVTLFAVVRAVIGLSRRGAAASMNVLTALFCIGVVALVTVQFWPHPH